MPRPPSDPTRRPSPRPTETGNPLRPTRPEGKTGHELRSTAKHKVRGDVRGRDGSPTGPKRTDPKAPGRAAALRAPRVGAHRRRGDGPARGCGAGSVGRTGRQRRRPGGRSTAGRRPPGPGPGQRGLPGRRTGRSRRRRPQGHRAGLRRCSRADLSGAAGRRTTGRRQRRQQQRQGCGAASGRRSGGGPFRPPGRRLLAHRSRRHPVNCLHSSARCLGRSLRPGRLLDRGRGTAAAAGPTARRPPRSEAHPRRRLRTPGHPAGHRRLHTPGQRRVLAGHGRGPDRRPGRRELPLRRLPRRAQRHRRTERPDHRLLECAGRLRQGRFGPVGRAAGPDLRLRREPRRPLRVPRGAAAARRYDGGVLAPPGRRRAGRARLGGPLGALPADRTSRRTRAHGTGSDVMSTSRAPAWRAGATAGARCRDGAAAGGGLRRMGADRRPGRCRRAVPGTAAGARRTGLRRMDGRPADAGRTGGRGRPAGAVPGGDAAAGTDPGPRRTVHRRLRANTRATPQRPGPGRIGGSAAGRSGSGAAGRRGAGLAGVGTPPRRGAGHRGRNGAGRGAGRRPGAGAGPGGGLCGRLAAAVPIDAADLPAAGPLRTSPHRPGAAAGRLAAQPALGPQRRPRSADVPGRRGGGARRHRAGLPGRAGPGPGRVHRGRRRPGRHLGRRRLLPLGPGRCLPHAAGGHRGHSGDAHPGHGDGRDHPPDRGHRHTRRSRHRGQHR